MIILLLDITCDFLIARGLCSKYISNPCVKGYVVDLLCGIVAPILSFRVVYKVASPPLKRVILNTRKWFTRIT